MAGTRRLFLLINEAEYELADTFETDFDEVVKSLQTRVERLAGGRGPHPRITVGPVSPQRFQIKTKEGSGDLFGDPDKVASAALILEPAKDVTPTPLKAASSGEVPLSTVGF